MANQLSSDETTAGCAALVGGGLVLGLLVGIGITAHSFWIALGVFGGLVLLSFGLNSGSNNASGGFLVFTLLGLILTLAMGQISGFRGEGWWIGLMVLYALAIGVVAINLGSSASGGAGTVGVLLALLCVGLAIAIPFYNDRLLGRGEAAAPSEAVPTEAAAVSEAEPTRAPAAEPTRAPAAEPTRAPAVVETSAPPARRVDFGGFFSRLGASISFMPSLLLAAVTSLWGWVYLVGTFLIGLIGIKRWGGIIFLLGLLLGLWVWVSMVPGVEDLLKDMVRSSPTIWFVEWLRFSAETFGSPAYGALLGGAFLGFLTFPVQRETVIASGQFRTLGQVGQIRQIVGLDKSGGFGNTAMMNLLERSGFSWGRYLLAIGLLLLLSAGFPIMLWVALRRFAVMDYPLGFALLGIPDITVPNWKPVWALGYFLVALLMGGISVISVAVQAKLDLIDSNAAAYLRGGSVVGALVAALFVPSGVLMLIFGSALTGLAFTLATSRMVSRARGKLGAAALIEAVREREIRQHLQEVEQRIQAEDVSGAKAALAKLLQVDPHHEKAGDLERRIRTLERALEMRRAAQLMAAEQVVREIKTRIEAEDVAGAEGLLAELRRKAPDHAEIRSLQSKIAALKSRLKEREVGELKAQFQQRLSSGDRDGADKLLRELEATAPDDPELADLREKIKSAPGNVMWEYTASPVVDMLAAADNTYLVLDEQGQLARWQNGAWDQVRGVQADQPRGMAAITDRQFVVLDGDGKLFVVTLAGRGQPEVERHSIGVQGNSLAVNPLGSMVVVAGLSGEVAALFLKTRQEKVLVDDIAGASSVAFSADSAHLAIGTQYGETRVVHVSTGKLKTTFIPMTYDAGTVIGLARGAGDTWVALYEKGYLICWGSDGRHLNERQLPSTPSCLTVDPESGRIAVGDTDGQVVVRPPDLAGEPLFSQLLHNRPVAQIAFLRGGLTAVSVGRGGHAMRISLPERK